MSHPAPLFSFGGFQTDFARCWSREGKEQSDVTREAIRGDLGASGLPFGVIESIPVGNGFGELQSKQSHFGAIPASVIPELTGLASIHEWDSIELHDGFAHSENSQIDPAGLGRPDETRWLKDAGGIRLGCRIPVTPSRGPVDSSYPVAGARRFATLNIGGVLGTVCAFMVESALKSSR